MALQKIFTLTGITETTGDFWHISKKKESFDFNCYVKVENISGSKDNLVALVSFTSDKIKGKKSYEFSPNLEGNNFIAQAYEYLKSLPEFVGAIDC